MTDDTLSVNLSDGRTIAVPLAWFPRLVHASQKERNNWRLMRGARESNIDEDISVEGLLAGRPSGEGQVSFKKWLNRHQSRLTNRSSRRSLPPAAESLAREFDFRGRLPDDTRSRTSDAHRMIEDLGFELDQPAI